MNAETRRLLLGITGLRSLALAEGALVNSTPPLLLVPGQGVSVTARSNLRVSAFICGQDLSAIAPA
jgi:hypothetical protein